MKLIADCHLHIYPFHNLKLIIENCFKNFSKHKASSDKSIMAIFLAERHDCDEFNKLKNLNGDIQYDIKVEKLKDSQVLKIKKQSEEMLVFAGRQIITKEKLEVLGLTIEERIKDGLPIREVIDKILKCDGIPVLSWAPGKWFFKRGKIIKELLNEYKAGELLLCDSSLRPYLWGTPTIFKFAKKIGHSIVAGSDPLPVAGEEHFAGRYGCELEGDFQEDNPVKSIRTIFKSQKLKVKFIGKRINFITLLMRLYKNFKSKKTVN